MNSPVNLSGQVALVSGSSSGIGKIIAYHLLKNGATVYINGRSAPELEKTFQEFSEEFRERVFKFRGDLTKTDVIINLLNEIESNHDKIDILVANIGSGRSQTGWDVPDALWTESMEKNFFGAVRLSRESLQRMTGQKKGAIVFIASITGIETIAAPIPYSCAKAALLHYMKNLADTVGKHGVRVNAVSPGNILFPGGTWDRKLNENPGETTKYIDETVPMQKFGTPDDIANMVCYLVSDRAGFITGANFVVDGGQTRSI